MAFYVIQFLTGLASASSLFLAACGLSIIFGVTRVVNFAHGAFYMLGAYAAYTASENLSGGLGFWGGLIAAALGVAAVGALVEMLLLRRVYAAPELYQLLATFGVALVIEDVCLLVWGPSDLVGRRAPGLSGAVAILGHRFPSYDIFLIVLGPVVLLMLWLAFHRTRWGVLVRAATQDRLMVSALGVNEKWLFTGVFALGIFLAALGGALHIPRGAVSRGMDLDIIVEVFVIVVIGGLGSVRGAFLAAVLVSELNAFGILVLPKVSLVIVFLVMIAVLVSRPYGIFGRAESPQRAAGHGVPAPWQTSTKVQRLAALAIGAALAAAPLIASSYLLTVGAEILIFALFAASLHFLMGPAGLNSFGHAAYFGLGAYGAALAAKTAGFGMVAAVGAGVVLGLIGAALFGFFCVRLTGVYFAMLTLAFAQIVWSVAFQWVDVTGGDNGIVGVWPPGWAASPAHFYWLALGIAVLALAALRSLIFSPFGYAVRALRDSQTRAKASGIFRSRFQWAAFVVAGTFAALAGALFAFLKGSVFPDALSISFSVDALVMVLLGGVETVSGAVAGAVVYKALSIWLLSVTDYSKLVLGSLIVLIVALMPKGILGTLASIRLDRAAAGRGLATAARKGATQTRGAE